MKLYLSGFNSECKISTVIKHINEAYKITRDFINKYDLCASTYDYGFITDNNKNLLYVVAYNGYVFKPEEYFGNSSDKVHLESDVGKIAVKEFNWKGF